MEQRKKKNFSFTERKILKNFYFPPFFSFHKIENQSIYFFRQNFSSFVVVAFSPVRFAKIYTEVAKVYSFFLPFASLQLWYRK